MPTVASHLCSVVTETYMSNCDVGKKFLKLLLEPKLYPFAGLDFTCLFPANISAKTPVIEGCWEQMLMRFSPSPYLATKGLTEVEQMIRGNRKLSGNVFEWGRYFKSPGNDPSMPWVYKVNWNRKRASEQNVSSIVPCIIQTWGVLSYFVSQVAL